MVRSSKVPLFDMSKGAFVFKYKCPPLYWFWFSGFIVLLSKLLFYICGEDRAGQEPPVLLRRAESGYRRS